LKWCSAVYLLFRSEEKRSIKRRKSRMRRRGMEWHKITNFKHVVKV
jgi:hypothetical protein